MNGAATTVICRSDGLPDWIAIAGVGIAGFGVLVGVLQLNRIASSLRISREANTIGTVAHFATRYHQLMQDALNAKPGDVRPGSWWYHYWDLFTEEYTFFSKGFLDADIFELWVGELATVYQQPPAQGLEARCDAHEAYLNVTLPAHRDLKTFFVELKSASLESDDRVRAIRVHEMVIASAHGRGWVSKLFHK